MGGGGLGGGWGVSGWEVEGRSVAVLWLSSAWEVVSDLHSIGVGDHCPDGDLVTKHRYVGRFELAGKHTFHCRLTR